VTNSIDELDEWLRGDFVRINTQLEEAYFADGVDLIRGRPELDTLKRTLVQQGGAHMERLARAQARKAGGHEEGAVDEIKRMELDQAWDEERTGITEWTALV